MVPAPQPANTSMAVWMRVRGRRVRRVLGDEIPSMCPRDPVEQGHLRLIAMPAGRIPLEVIVGARLAET